MDKFILLLFAIPALAFFQGCNRIERPADMPDLKGCEITVVADGKPLEGALMTLHQKDPDFKWGISNYSDKSGKAPMVTNGRYPGVPEGDYIVTIAKWERDPGAAREVTPDNLTEHVSRRGAMIDVYTWIDPVYAEKDTTPLTISIGKKAVKKEFDVGKVERKFLRKEPAE